MALRQDRICDVFGGARAAKPYCVTIQRMNDEPALIPDVAAKSIAFLFGTEVVFTRELDLSRRGLDRLKRFVMRGTEKPNKNAAGT
jgi:hypothetical protein